MKKIAIGLGAMFLALTSACGSSSGSDSSSGGGGDKPYRVLFIGPLSGPAAAIADAQVAGIKAGIKTVNASGGINGRKVQLVTKDDQLDPTKAISILQSALSSNRPDLVVPGVTSDEGLAILPVLTQNKILSMGGLVSDEVNQTKKYPYFFSNGQGLQPSADAQATALKAKGITSLSYVYPDTANGASAIAAMKTAASKDGITVKGFTFSPTAVDLTDVLQRADSSKPGALVFDAYGAATGYVLQARQKLKLSTPTYGDLSACISNVSALVPASATAGVNLVCQRLLRDGPATNQAAAFTKFKAAIKLETPSLKQPLNLYSAPYDMLTVLQAAAKAAGSTDTVKISAEMLKLPSSLDTQIVTYSTWGYTSSDHQVQVPETDYVITAATPLVNGQFKPAS